MKPSWLFCALYTVFFMACTKDQTRLVPVEGYVFDKLSRQPVADVEITVEAVKSGTGSFFTFGSKTEPAGKVRTNKNGYYKGTFRAFPEATHLIFHVNTLGGNGRHTDLEDVLYYLSEPSQGGLYQLDFFLTPKALLRISFKNTQPVADNDSFSFTYGWLGQWTGPVVASDNCGTVAPDAAQRYIGKDVCGSITVETEAEKTAFISWESIKAGVQTGGRDSIFIERDRPNGISINY